MVDLRKCIDKVSPHYFGEKMHWQVTFSLFWGVNALAISVFLILGRKCIGKLSSNYFWEKMHWQVFSLFWEENALAISLPNVLMHWQVFSPMFYRENTLASSLPNTLGKKCIGKLSSQYLGAAQTRIRKLPKDWIWNKSQWILHLSVDTLIYFFVFHILKGKAQNEFYYTW